MKLQKDGQTVELKNEAQIAAYEKAGWKVMQEPPKPPKGGGSA